MPRPSKRIPTVSNESSPEAQQVIDHLRTLLSPVTQEKERSVWQTVCKTQGNLEFNYFFHMASFFFWSPGTTPDAPIGLWARVSQRSCARDRFFPLLSGFPVQITWLPVAWAHDPFFLTGPRFPIPKHVTSGFPVTSGSGDVISGPFRLSPRSPMTRGVPMTTPRPIRSQKLSTNQKPVFSPYGRTLLLLFY